MVFEMMEINAEFLVSVIMTRGVCTVNDLNIREI
jgi:hypothetical protein